ncbi:MAG: hypothetical protein RUMPE_00513 [Eubacteriales bacterium SKADARSKE-1]|nr:hypothetical protein [Eubacteriales bacterium SKADARSKE-1]
MELLTVFLTSLGSLIALFLLTELMGKKQMAELSMFDYIIGITIGSIAAEMATSLEDDFLKPLLAMVVYALAAILISYVSCKSIKLRKIFTGEPLILFENKKLYKDNLKKAKLDLSEFLTQCRTNGYFDISNLDTVILESNGKLSFLPVSSQRPATPTDLNVDVTQEKMPTNVVFDGVLLKDNLKYTGNDEIWLKKQLKEQGASRMEDVFLAICDNNNKLTVYLITNKKNHN